jgi:hypothetical protein
MEKLRSPLKAHGIDEQRKEDRLDAAINRDTELPNDDADQQCSGDAAQQEAANLDFPAR